MTRIVISVKEEQLKEADRIARARGLSRAEVFRMGLEKLREEDRKKSDWEETLKLRREIGRDMDEAAKVIAATAPDWKPMEIIRHFRKSRGQPWHQRKDPPFALPK